MIGLLSAWTHAAFGDNDDKIAMFAGVEQDFLEPLKEIVFQMLLLSKGQSKDEMLKLFTDQDKHLSLSLEFQSLIKDLDQDFLISTIVAILNSNRAINWSHFLKIISSIMRSQRAELTSTLVSKLEEKMLNCLENDIDKFLPLLLLCRQASLETSSSYTKFFQSSFVTNKELLGNQKKHLFQALTQLVPFESASMLTVHLNHPIPAPSMALRDMASDYNMLARTRRKDLIDSKKGPDTGLFGHQTKLDNVDEVDKEIGKIIESFEASNCQDIPQLVIKMSMFNKPYFTHVFIPRLLTLSQNCSVKKAFVQKLRDAKKIN